MANPNKKTEINDDELIHQKNELKQLKDEIVNLENKLDFFWWPGWYQRIDILRWYKLG